MRTASLPETICLTGGTEEWQGLAEELASYRHQIGQKPRQEAAADLAAYKAIILSRLLHDRLVNYNAVCSDSTIEYAEHLEPVLLQQAYHDIYLFVANTRVAGQSNGEAVLARLLGPILRRFSVA